MNFPEKKNFMTLDFYKQLIMTIVLLFFSGIANSTAPQTVSIWKDKSLPVTLYNYGGVDDKVRPAMLILPGGGYGVICETTEGKPVAEYFAKLGFRTFVLCYRAGKEMKYPNPQQDALRAIRVIRANAEKWKVIADNIAVCGFSAGGHLAASAATHYDKIAADNGDDIDKISARPDAVVLCYPVISFMEEDKCHYGSGHNLLKDRFEELRKEMSLHLQINDNTPPAFIWHTAEDQMVPVENSLQYARKMKKFNRPFELHIFPQGPHGMQLGYGRQDISRWPEQAKLFLQGTVGFRFPEPIAPARTIVLTFDDFCKSHYTNVAPLLKKYDFCATFYITRFNIPENNPDNSLMTKEELKELDKQGFDIGNHTWNHPDMRNLTDTENASQIDQLEAYLHDAGIKKSVSFAFPGGPFAENAAGVLKEKGFQTARTTECHTIDLKNLKNDPMRLPGFALQKGDDLAFYSAVSKAKGSNAVILVFHGVPDTRHEFVSTPQHNFEKYMKYLHDNNYRVISVRQYYEECRGK
jgi:acetyl esterase/lipase